MVAKRLYRRCHIPLCHRVTLVDLVEHDMLGFDVIIGMIDCMHVIPLLVLGLEWLDFNIWISLL